MTGRWWTTTVAIAVVAFAVVAVIWLSQPGGLPALGWFGTD